MQLKGSSKSLAPGVALRWRRRGAALLMFTALAAGTGCYGYHRTELTAIEPGEQVRVVLDDQIYRRVAPGAPRGAAPRLEGDFLGATADSVALSIWIGQAYRGTPFQTAHQTVTVPRGEVVAFERREISTARTALAAASVVGLVAYLITQVDFTPDPNPGDDGATPPPPPGSDVVGVRGLDLLGGFRALLGR